MTSRSKFLAALLLFVTAGSALAQTVAHGNMLPPLIPREKFFDNPEKANAKISPDGAVLVVQDGGDGLNVWDVKERQTKAKLKDVARASMDFVFTSDGKNVILPHDTEVKLLDLETGRSTVLYRHAGGVVCLACSPKDQVVASSASRSAAPTWTCPSRRWAKSRPR